jgi:hypothetical protein
MYGFSIYCFQGEMNTKLKSSLLESKKMWSSVFFRFGGEQV